MDNEAKQFLVQKYADWWMKENPDLVNDIEELSAKIVFFNAKWGTNFGLDLGDRKA